MNPAPFHTQNVPSSCVYSAQGNLVCQKSKVSDPILQLSPYSCGTKQEQVEKYMNFDLNSIKSQMATMMGTEKKEENYMNFDISAIKGQMANMMSTLSSTQEHKEKYENKANRLPPYDNLSTAMNMNSSVSPWPF